NHRGGTIQRIDPATNRIVPIITVGGELDFTDVSGIGDVLWACTNVDSVLHQIDLSTGTETATVQAQCELGLHDVIDGKLWQSPGLKNPDILVIDFQTGKILRRIPADPNTWWGPPVAIDSHIVFTNGNGTILRCQPDGSSCDTINVKAPMWPLAVA